MIDDEPSAEYRAILHRLESLDAFKEGKKFLGCHLKSLGKRHGRVIYRFDTGRVLKLAQNEMGVEQNHVENSIQGEWFTKCFNHGNNFLWILSEHANRARSEHFTQTFQAPMQEVFARIENGGKHTPLNAVIRAIRLFDLRHQEICLLDSWGILRRRLVLRNFGLTNSAWKRGK